MEIWSPKWDNVWEMVVSKITMVVVSVHKLSHYINCCRGNSGLVGCATHLELRQTSTKPLKQLPCTGKQLNDKKLLHPWCRLGFESSYHRDFLATQTACFSLKVVWIYKQVKEINWLQWLEEWVPLFHEKWTLVRSGSRSSVAVN